MPTERSVPSHPFRELARSSPARAAALVFVLAAAFFSALLALPISTDDPNGTPLIDAIFTGVSAVTVTGLTTVDTATHWSLFGEIVILVGIQTGGLGIVTIALLLARAVTRHLGVQSKVFAQQSIGTSKIGEVGTLLRIVVLTTFAIEGTIFLLLLPPFLIEESTWYEGVGNALFYAVSSFNNAGFSVHPGGLQALGTNVWIIGPVMLGVFVGSFGFPVFLTLITQRWNRKRWTLHTKLTLAMTTGLLLIGAIGWGLSEWNNPGTVGDESPLDKILHALFASTMMRSGGFTLTDTAAAHPVTLLLTDALMFVGGGSASTAGGIKVTTLAVLFLAIIAEARGDKDLRVAGRSIPSESLRVAISVTFLGATLVLVATALILAANPSISLARVAFEVISAFATCGLSVGLSAELDTFGKFVLSLLMLAGRIGPIGLAAALALKQRTLLYSLPEERPIIG
ncbi:potassium transporter TrkG [Salinibacterium sp. G-O1]|uniref:TrkH family potassium uptake protein n=1 Tax=Salinibacterium sp. G-O1 TaxID=3046208 RepID=UPI0024B950FA|nr:potassium transporter TrkG [Salinibacterium sp. G-O1]MDJ0336048.1 potassium transporter TrkG [Salinibacterium sp. G-O1]